MLSVLWAFGGGDWDLRAGRNHLKKRNEVVGDGGLEPAEAACVGAADYPPDEAPQNPDGWTKQKKKKKKKKRKLKY